MGHTVVKSEQCFHQCEDIVLQCSLWFVYGFADRIRMAAAGFVYNQIQHDEFRGCTIFPGLEGYNRFNLPWINLKNALRRIEGADSSD